MSTFDFLDGLSPSETSEEDRSLADNTALSTGSGSVDDLTSAGTEDGEGRAEARATTESSVSNEAPLSDSSFHSIGYLEPIAGVKPGTFIEIIRDHREAAAEEHDMASFSGTIVSSASPSVDHFQGYFDPPVAVDQSQDPWALSPHPLLTVQNPLSISTTETVYRNVASLNGDDASSLTGSMAGSLLSLRPSLMETSVIEDYSLLDNATRTQSNDNEEDRATADHNPEAFMNVASRLARDTTASDSQVWFAHFSERDWVKFEMEAEMVLNALESTQQATHLPLPPEAPTVPWSSSGRRIGSYDAKDFLPPAFICSLCSDVIVGATTLDCGCAKATVCTRCWESHSTVAIDGDDGVVIVEQNRVCPSCGKDVNRVVPCHAMDIAILHCVKALPRRPAVQTAYYRRLGSWREEVKRRGGKVNVSRDRLLAELIQREEELLWKRRRRSGAWRAKSTWFRIGEVVLVVVGAGLSLGALALSKGRRN